MKNFLRWTEAIYCWLRQVPITSHYWWAGAIVAAAIFVLIASGCTEKAFRLVGMSLQLVGVVTVMLGISKTRADFGQPSLRSQFQTWAKRFPALHPTPITISLGGIDLVHTGRGSIHTTRGPAIDQSVEGRLDHLEKVVNDIGLELAKTRSSIEEAEHKTQQALDKQSDQFAEEVASVAKRIEATATGGVHVSAIGVIFLFLGTVFGGMAPELHDWWGHAP